jgi:DNA polymerase-1
LAVNAIVQGSAADIMKIGMIRCFRALDEGGFETEMVLQIHDELLFEGPEDEAAAVAELAVREMVGAWDLDPPLEVEVGTGADWLAAK